MMSFLLVPIHTEYLPDESIYGEISVIFAYFVLFNVVLSYGMETAFFRFFNKQEAKNQVMSTSAWSLVLSTLIFLGLGIGFQNQISGFVQIPSEYINLIIWILALDAFVIIPFAYLRALGQPKKYAIIKIINVFINVLLNIFFLVWLVNWYSEISVFEKIYIPDFEINYVFIANLVASATTLVLLLPFYFKLKFSFNIQLWKKMMRYGIPVLIAGVAFSINEVFDRILLKYLLPAETAEAQIGIYSACYKLAVFMTLFATAFRLGIEPFFFSHAKTQNPQKAYALITKYFVITGSLIFLGVIAFIEPLKLLIIRDEAYYDALEIVPIILLANLCLGIYHNLSVWYKITDRTRFGAYISVIGAIITLAVNFILIPVIGYLGSAIATLMAYFTMMTLSYIYGKKYYPIPFQTGKIMMYLLLSTALGAISFYYFTENYIFGIASILVLASLIYANEHKEIKSMLKS